MFQVLIGILTILSFPPFPLITERVSSPYRYSNNLLFSHYLWFVPVVSSPYRYSNNTFEDFTGLRLSLVSSPYRYSNNFVDLMREIYRNIGFKSL